MRHPRYLGVLSIVGSRGSLLLDIPGCLGILSMEAPCYETSGGVLR